MKTSHKVKLSILDRELVQGFLESRGDSKGLYEKRGGFKDVDIIAGALGELAVSRFLRKRGIRVSEPDFTIHGVKTYSSDLTDGFKHFHVKTQTKESEKRYGSSWILQRHDPMLKKAPYRHYAALCVIDMDELVVEIKGFVSVNTLVRYGHIGECKAPMFRQTKVALYWETIKQMSRKALWGITWK